MPLAILVQCTMHVAKRFWKKMKNKNERPKLVRFFSNIKSLYAAALGIEILCIAAAEIGENSSFALFGYGTIYQILLLQQPRYHPNNSTMSTGITLPKLKI